MKIGCDILLSFGINGSLRKREVQAHPQASYTEYYLFNSASNLKAYSYDGLDFAYYGYNAANTRTYKLSMLNMHQWTNGQPFPLHFSFGEVFLRSAKSKQACIPLSLSENVLCWLKESLRQASKKELVHFFEREQTSPKVTEAKERAFRGGGKNPVHHARQLAERRNRRCGRMQSQACLGYAEPRGEKDAKHLNSQRRSAPLSCYGRRIFSVTPQVGEMTYSNREIQRIQLWQDATVSSEVPPCNLLFSIAYGQVCQRSAKMMQASLLHSLRANSLCFVSFIFSGRRKKERNEGKNFYYHTNHLGSTAYVTDNNAIITQGFLYAPFGEITTEYNANFGNNVLPKYSFNAKELDEETGMYYYEARYYKPPVFTSRDPMMDQKPWLTPYHYCSNNPIKRIDPNGNKDRPFNRKKDKRITKLKGTETPIKYTLNTKGEYEITEESKNAYNCHYYAWHSSNREDTPNKDDRMTIKSGDEYIELKKWDNNPADDIKEKNARQLAADEDNIVGDIMICYTDKNKNGKYDDGEFISHSAVVTKVDEQGYTTEVTGKMGQGPISTNHPDAPRYYKRAREKFFSFPKKQSRAYFRLPQLPQPTTQE